MAMVVEISCVEAWQMISEMIDGALAPDLLLRMELHLKHCAHCKAVFDGTWNMVQLLGDEQMIELPAGLHERLFERLSAELCGR